MESNKHSGTNGAQGEDAKQALGAAEPVQHKEFKLTSLAVNNKITIYVITAIITIMGIISYVSTPKEAQPEVIIPIIYIATPYFGVSPSDIESQITQHIEKELKSITGIKKITSQSREGYSGITVEFNPDMNIDEAMQKVREKVDLAKTDLPKDAEEPIIQEINLSEMPIMYLNISGDYSLVKLKDISEDIQDHIEQFPEVLEVVLSGGLEQEVQVNVDLARLKYYNISFKEIIDAVQAENTTVPGGTIDIGNMKFLVRVPGEFEASDAVKDIVVKTPAESGPIYLRDVANIDFGFKDRSSYARLDGAQVVTLGIKKRAGTNLLNVADKVTAYTDGLLASGSLPQSTKIKVTNNSSEMVVDMVSNLENNILFGLILVVGVLLFFMGVRNAILVGVAVPLSMLLSFIIIQSLGFTMNMIVLFSLILALGMLVDNAIVVVENIYRYVNEGFGKVEAAKKATAEVAIPITTSTLTTIFAFTPMAFWPGIVGEFMKYLPITLIITLSSSLFVALVINPTLSSAVMRKDGEKGKKLTTFGKVLVGVVGLFAALIAFSINYITLLVFLGVAVIFYLLNKFMFEPIGVWFRDSGFPALQRKYLHTLTWSLNNRALVFGSMVGMLVVVVMLFGQFSSGFEFFPNIEPRDVWVDIESPIGTNVEQSNKIAKSLEESLKGVDGISDVQAIVTTVGSGGGDPFGGGGGGGTPNTARIALSFKKYQERNQSPYKTLAAVRERLGTTLDGADVKVTKMEMGPPTGKPVNIEVRGEDFAIVSREADKILSIIKNDAVASKLDALGSDLDKGSPEMTIRIDREKAALYGLNTALIGSTIRSAVNGTEASKYRSGEDEYDITVRLEADQRTDLESLFDLVIMKDGKQIPLASVASWEVTNGYGAINRKNQSRLVTVQAGIVEGNNANDVVAEVQTLLGKTYNPPPGYAYQFTGQQEDQQETSSFLALAFVLTIMLVFGTLVAQFNSVVTPFIIMFSVIFSIIGVLIGLMIFQVPFGMVMTGIGVISLAGVAVNNAIVLIDFIEVRYKRDGMTRREAILDAGVTRLRPVMLTTVTTILGLVPLALGLNFNFITLFTNFNPDFFMGGEQAQWWFSLCIAVIFGLTFATFLTLIVVPVMYSLSDSFSRWFRIKVYGKGNEEGDTATQVQGASEKSSITNGASVQEPVVAQA